MTDQDQTPSNDNSGKGYNIAITPKAGSIDTTPAANGTRKTKFRGTLTIKGQQRERTVVAQGKAAEAIEGMIKDGESVSLRVLFSHMPSEEEGKTGAEYLTVLGVPQPARKAA